MVLCSGNRNTPFIAAVSWAKGLKVFHHFSERSAAFFALGRVKLTQKPVAVIVTSGTAAVELHAACVEAFYSALPLILVTADRPQRFRGSGSPQSIDQKNLFGAATAQSFDIEALTEIPKAISTSGPVHLNVCFEEPLLSEEPQSWTPTSSKISAQLPKRTHSAELNSFLASHKSPLVLAGRLAHNELTRIELFLKNLGAPIYAEVLSGLRESATLNDLLIRSGDSFLKNQQFDSVLRIGGVPTTSFWRELERNPKLSKISVLSLSEEGFSGLARESLCLKLSQTELEISSPKNTDTKKIIANDRAYYENLCRSLQDYPKSEAALFRKLSERIDKEALIYLGNSLPIREWDLAADFKANNRSYEANRGVNGIDGQLSTFLGCVQSGRENWCIVGDLTALYDMESFFILTQLPTDAVMRIVVVNNSGGRLFDLLPDYQRYFQGKAGAAALIQPHQLSFEPLAKMWSLSYQRWDGEVPDTLDLPAQCLIELGPDLEQSAEFWRRAR